MQPYGTNILINYLFNTYGFLLPANQPQTGKDFAGLIEKTYSMEDARNKAMFKLAGSMIGTITRKITGEIIHAQE